MDEKYKYMFLKHLYQKLNLLEVEEKLREQQIIPIDRQREGLYTKISQYFSLENTVDETRLSSELEKLYNYYFSLPLEELEKKYTDVEFIKFMEESYKILLFPNIEENYCFYGPPSYNYVAPRDCIVLGFNYYEFNISDDKFDEIHSQQMQCVCNILNYIQETLSSQIGMNVAVLRYNEYYEMIHNSSIIGVRDSK